MHPSQPRAVGQQRRVGQIARQADASSMFNLLTGPQLLDSVKALRPEHRERLYPPTETLAMFVAQALSSDGRCQGIVDAFQVQRLAIGLPPGSPDTSADCQARRRLPIELIQGTLRQCGHLLTRDAPRHWHWRGRRVLLTDATTTTLPDNEVNQAASPQPDSQKPGLGFPLMRVQALICLGRGALCDAATGPCVGKGGEKSRDGLQGAVYLLAYNLIRLLMAQSAWLSDQIPRQLSFKHTMQVWTAWTQIARGRENGERMYQRMILIARPRVGLRSGRIEPRLIKRRRNRFGLLMEPSADARERVRAFGHPKQQR